MPSRQPRSGNEAFRGGAVFPCPSCGASIGLNEPHSYRAVLTEPVRAHLNGLIVDARNFTRGLDTYLARLTHRHELSDPYGTPYAREELSQLIAAGLIERATWLDLTSDVEGEFDSQAARQRRESAATPERLQRGGEAARTLAGDSLRAMVYRQLSEGDASELIRQVQDEYGVLRSRTAAGHWAEYFHLLLDTHDFDFNFAAFPTLESDSVAPVEKCRRYARLLLGPGLERRANALLLDLIQEQPAMLAFLQSNRLATHRTAINKLVGCLRPELGRYFDYIDCNCSSLPDHEREQVRKNLERARFLLLTLHGHAWRMLKAERKQEFESALGGDFTAFHDLFLKDIYALSDQTEITGRLLSRMLAARTLLPFREVPRAGWLPDWVRTLFRNIAGFVLPDRDRLSWLEHIGKLVVIQCANQVETDRPVATASSSPHSPDGGAHQHVASDANRDFSQLLAVAPEVSGVAPRATERVFAPCNCALSDWPSFSVVLLGSPGTGKTTAFEAGLAKLWRVAEALGLELVPVDLESSQLIEQIQNDFFLGKLRDPTQVNRALNFEARLIRAPQKRVRISVVDVPGEKVNALLNGNGADSELRRILRHANTIVFLFDLWSDKMLWRQLAASGSEAFASQLELAKSLEAKRSASEGYFADQTLLLSKLIDMLKSERPGDEASELNFMCLFTKFDTLASIQQGRSNPHLIFSELTRIMQTRQLLVSVAQASRQSGGQSAVAARAQDIGFGDHESLAGLGADRAGAEAARNEEPGGDDLDPDDANDNFSRQLAICRELSELTKKNLELFGNLLPTNASPAAKLAFAARIRNGVVGKIETHFPTKSYFLPISALGRMPSPSESEARKVERPNSVLVEYAYLLPLMAAFRSAVADHCE